MIATFLEAMLFGVCAVIGIVLLRRAAWRLGIQWPRPLRRLPRLHCVRPLAWPEDGG
jgi:hypothetical protein